MPSLKIYTLGCKLNSLESESYIDAFKQAGYELYRGQGTGGREQGEGRSEQPSFIIVNTCTVTSKADQKARRVIRKVLRDYPEAVVIVTGCYAELEAEAIKKIPSRRGAVDSSNRAQRLLVLKRNEVLKYLNNNSRSLVSFDDRFQFFPEKFSKHTRSFLKIQDGCDNKCTYCRIRLARGKSVSLPAEQVLERLKILEKDYAETVLTGVNICQYNEQLAISNEQKNINLFELIEYLLSNTEKISLRLSSLDPHFIVDSLLTANCSLLTDRVRPHFHLSIQSCSEKILQRMGRSYNAETIEKAVLLLRKAKDDPFLACDIITGFPGETEEDFNETYELCKKLGFAWIHVFPYSKRPGTAAASFKDTVRESEVIRRVKLLTDLAWQGRREYVKRWLGREVEIIVERKKKNEERRKITVADNICPYTYGISENYLKVLILHEDNNPVPGTVLRCKLIEQSLSNNDDYDACAEIVRVVRG